jgi:hypothetical protein
MVRLDGSVGSSIRNPERAYDFVSSEELDMELATSRVGHEPGDNRSTAVSRVERL